MSIFSSNVWDKFVVNLGFGPKMYVLSDFEIIKNLSDDSLGINFSVPVILDVKTMESIVNDGYYLYMETVFATQDYSKVMLAGHKENKDVTTPFHKEKDLNRKVVISEIQFIIDVVEMMAKFNFKVEKGLRDGFIENVDEIGMYYLKHDLHKDLDWWNDFELPSGPFRCASFYDVKILNGENSFNNARKYILGD